MGIRPKPRRARSARSLELDEARRVRRTGLGTASGLIAMAAGLSAVLLTLASIGATQRTFGVFLGAAPGGTSPLLLTYLLGGALVIGGLGLLVPATWGWWLAMAGALLGPLDIFRIYRNLYGSINWEHPNVDEVVTKLVVFGAVPAVLYGGLVALLIQRPLRESYRVSTK